MVLGHVGGEQMMIAVIALACAATGGVVQSAANNTPANRVAPLTARAQPLTMWFMSIPHCQLFNMLSLSSP
jgi:hypothetical protein